MNLGTRNFHLLCCFTYSVLCIAWSARVGPQFSWDYLHYHLYIVQAWWEHRLPDELFAASGQGYLNPLPHLPFYAAYLATPQNSLLGTLIMAFLHSSNLWLLHLISSQLIGTESPMRRFVVVCSVILGALSPGFLFELGTSYTDIIVSIPALAAMLALLLWMRRATETSWWLLHLSGILAGIAVGLKPSLLVFCGALAIAILCLTPTRRLLPVFWRVALSGTLGGLLAGGPHAWMLWQAFANPVFPLFNGVFQSPWFPPVNLVAERFIPQNFFEALMFPFNMADSGKRSSFEAMTVDIRPVYLLGLLVLWGLYRILAKLLRQSGRSARMPDLEKLFWISFLIFIPAWIQTSGNIRYAIQSLLLLGPAIGLLAMKLGERRHFIGMFAILLPITGQAALATNLNTPNILGYNTKAWARPWFALDIPAPLDTTPAYYLSIQTQGYASLLHLFPEGSRFFNLVGQTTLPPDHVVLNHMRKDKENLKLEFRSLYAPLTIAGKTQTLESSISSQNALLSDYGYRVNESNCGVIKIQVPEFNLYSCALEMSPMNQQEQEKRQGIDRRIAYWEQKCPDIFKPSGFWSLQATETRRRFYPGTDFQMIAIADGSLLARDNFNSTRPLIHLEDANEKKLLDSCPPRKSR